MTTTDAADRERRSEVEFRSRMPRMVHGFTILHVDGYRPGGPGSYASAIVVSRDSAAGEFCTHRLIWASDRAEDDLYRWIVEHGDYGIGTFEKARQAAQERIARDMASAPPPPMPEYSIALDTRNPQVPYVVQHTVAIGRASSTVDARGMIKQRLADCAA